MELEYLNCPICGANHLEKDASDDSLWRCVYCGARFAMNTAKNEYAKLKSTIQADIGSMIDEAMLRAKEEKYYNLRSHLWEKVHAQYTDSAAIVSICRDIKKINPHDFLASFFEVANAGTPEEVAAFLNGISADENAVFMDLVVDFMIRSLNSKHILPVAHLIERAYKNQDLKKFEEYTTRLEQEAQKVDAGVYSTLIPRDVFIAYSSKDMDAVTELVELLESNGLSCFVAMRNLQHGRNAVANYSAALKSAIDNSKMIVFVSSKNSRNFSCDALTEELQYIRESEIKSAPAEFKNDYARLPYKYKKMRIEYRLDNTPSAVDRFVGDFFADLDYCETAEKVLARVADLKLYGQKDNAKSIRSASDDTVKPNLAEAKKVKEAKKPQNAPSPQPTKKQKPVAKFSVGPICFSSIVENFCSYHKTFITKETTAKQKISYFVGWILLISSAALLAVTNNGDPDVSEMLLPIMVISMVAYIGFKIAVLLEKRKIKRENGVLPYHSKPRSGFVFSSISLFLLGWIGCFSSIDDVGLLDATMILILNVWALITHIYAYCPREYRSIQFTEKLKPIPKKTIGIIGIIASFALIVITASINV